MAIVATQRGGLIECEGGPFTKSRNPAIKALTWKRVNDISERFAALNPYDLPGSVLKIEDDNYEPETKKQRQLWCYAISAKRYALFLRDDAAEPTLLRKKHNNEDDRHSEHGLGHLMNPSDPTSDDKKWIAAAWLAIVRRSLALPTKALRFAKRVAVGRITVSSPSVMKAFAKANRGKPYAQQIKPFNFIISSHVRKFGHPIGVDPDEFHLIAPYETDPRKWENMSWINQYSDKQYRITAMAAHPSRTMALAKRYADVLSDYEYHPESKCLDVTGAACSRQTVGLLGRRHISIDGFTFIGKESNSLEEVAAETTSDAADVYTEYADPARDEWRDLILPTMRATSAYVITRDTGISRRTVQRIRNGATKPTKQHRQVLITYFKVQSQDKAKSPRSPRV